MSKLEDAIKRLSPEQRALLERRLKQKRNDSAAQDKSIGSRPDSSEYPLSAGQRRLLALEQLYPNTPQFNITVAHHLVGSLDTNALEFGVRTVLQRHEALRSRFNLLNGAWQQQIVDVPEVVLPAIDLSDMPAEQRRQKALELIRQDVKTPFDLSTGPLLRAHLVKLAPTDHVFFLTVHHVAADAWSVNLLLQEVVSAYISEAQNATPDLPHLSIQYADFAHWQIDWLQTEDAQKQLTYWEKSFENDPVPLELPVDRNVSAVQSVEGRSKTIYLSEQLTAELKTFSLEQKLTPFTIFMSAFKALIYRYTSQNDMIVCAPIAGRNRVEVEPLIGYFNNVIAIRSSISDDMTYSVLADQIAKSSMAASDHQDIPFEVVADLQTLKKVPLTRAFFTFQDALTQAFSIPGIRSESIEIDSVGADFNLSIFVEQKGDDLAVVAEYKKHLFDETSISRLLTNYLEVLSTISSDPFIRLGDLPKYEMPSRETESTTEAAVTTLASNGVSDSSDELPAVVSSEISTSPISANDDLEQVLKRIWQRVLDLPDVGLHDNFFEIGGHSLMAVNMFNEIQKYVGELDLPLAALLEAPTIASLAQRIRNSDELDWSPLAIIQSGKGTIPIFCIHGAGGNVLLYRDLAIQLGPNQTVYGLQSQGMDGQRPILGRIEDMAALYTEAIRRTFPSGPYLLVGYCMGGVVALEIAQRLQKQGAEVALLSMLETYNWMKAPKETAWVKWKYRYEKVVFHIRNYYLLSGYEKKLFRAEKMAELKRRRKIWRGKLVNRLRPKKLIEATSDGPNLRALAAVWRANDEAVYHYEPEEYHDRILLFLPRQEYSYHKGEGLHWEGVARNLERHVLSVYPGGMLIQPFVKELAQALRAEIFRISAQRDIPALQEFSHNGQHTISERTSR